MSPVLLPVEDAAQTIVRAICGRRVSGGPPFLAAIDGPSGAGKSSIAGRVADLVDGALVHSDDFFNADLSDEDWDRRAAAERARDCIDWRRLRLEALEPLLFGRVASWHAFDWDAGPLPDGSYPFCENTTRVVPRPTIVLDGAYSSREELADVLCMTVLVDVPQAVRQGRLAARDGLEFYPEWHRRWGAAEDHYFGKVRPPTAFDLIVNNE